MDRVLETQSLDVLPTEKLKLVGRAEAAYRI